MQRETDKKTHTLRLTQIWKSYTNRHIQTDTHTSTLRNTHNNTHTQSRRKVIIYYNRTCVSRNSTFVVWVVWRLTIRSLTQYVHLPVLVSLTLTCVYVCVYVWVCVCVCVCVSVSVSVRVCENVWVVWVSVSMCVSVCLSVCMCMWWSVCKCMYTVWYILLFVKLIYLFVILCGSLTKMIYLGGGIARRVRYCMVALCWGLDTLSHLVILFLQVIWERPQTQGGMG